MTTHVPAELVDTDIEKRSGAAWYSGAGDR